eukprot:2141215-Pyramimonas_sp.AAC.1
MKDYRRLLEVLDGSRRFLSASRGLRKGADIVVRSALEGCQRPSNVVVGPARFRLRSSAACF